MAVDAEPSLDARGPILALRDEVGKVVVGQEGTLSGLVAALLGARPRAARGRAGRGQDAAW